MSAMSRKRLVELSANYYKEQRPIRPFQPGKDAIPASGNGYDQQELGGLLEAAMDFVLGEKGREETFERELARMMAARYAFLVNSGSIANLLAFCALTSPSLEERRIEPGDEVITVANRTNSILRPIAGSGAIPVLVDVNLPTYNLNTERLEQALSDRTKAVVVGHTLGNPFDMEQVRHFCNRHRLWLIEETCDAVGALYQGQPTGSFGDLATVSFYPGQQLTMGEGGAILTSDPLLREIVESLRDFGRNSPHFFSAADRFEALLSSTGFDLQASDLLAAVGLVQLQKQDEFIRKRRVNFQFLHEALRPLEHALVLPEETPGTCANWLGFPITVKESAPLSRNELILGLEEKQVGTRPVFPANPRTFLQSLGPHRVVGSLKQTERIHDRSFWIGLHPGLTEDMLTYSVEVIHKLLQVKKQI